MNRLPIDAALDALRDRLGEQSRLVLEAEPGAGKSTRVPLALLDCDWLDSARVLMLEPRRIAARNLAAYLAQTCGEAIGKRVGLNIRGHRRVSAGTRLEIITEGVLTRMIQNDPELAGVGAIIFDEFHERSLHADLGLSLALDVQRQLRPDLRLLVMSATLDGQGLSRWLDAALIQVPGRRHPVTVEHRAAGINAAARVGEVADVLAAAAQHAIDRWPGDLLIFAPGAGEIQATAERLVDRCADLTVRQLHGRLPLEEQRRALGEESTGRRRAVIATNIAESSLTVPGVRIVVDSGLARQPAFDPETGLTRLVTRRITRDSADQRAGRAGRLDAGWCLRLWSQETRLDPQREPEIRQADLAPLALELAAWGSDDLRWLDPPPEGALAQARDLLRELALIGPDGRITPLGRRAARWGTHPRLATMLETAASPLACDLAALLEGRDPLTRQDDRLDSRLSALREWRKRGGRGGAMGSIDQQARRWRARLGGGARSGRDVMTGKGARGEGASGPAGQLLLHAYPDRLAQRRADGRYLLAGGGGARLQPHSGLAGNDWLVCPGLRHGRPDSLISLAAAVNDDVVQNLAGLRGSHHQVLDWDDARQAVDAREVLRLGALDVVTTRWADPPPESITALLLNQLRKAGSRALPWTNAARRLAQRAAFVRRQNTELPDLGDAALMADLDDWLGPRVHGMSSLSDLKALDLHRLLLDRLGWTGRQLLDRLAPERLDIPSGRQQLIDYSDPENPVLAVKLQEMFGCLHSPRLGVEPVTLHLLSPAGRPLQITRDLASFWQQGYPEVRKEMRGRYPKHPWPEDPLTASATARTKRRGPAKGSSRGPSTGSGK